MLWLGMTGGIATGKSAVAKMFMAAGAPVIDADELSHQALRPDIGVYEKIIAEFGKGIVGPDRSIDRRRLGAIVFASKDKLRKLEELIHPVVKSLAEAKKRELEAKGVAFAIYDVPLLFEKNLQKDFDGVILVYATADQQRQRLRKRNDLTPKEIDDRIGSQIPIDKKRPMADYLIDNQGNIEMTRKRVLELVEVFRSQAQKPQE